jgi:hypothetical protein
VEDNRYLLNMPEEVREGYCKCGCGLLTTIPKYNDASKGWVAGKPLDWLSGHSSRKKVKYVVDPITGCWNWACHLYEGYGRVFLDGHWYPAHVVTYETKYGPVPNGKELDHLCRNRKCCNPDHVEPVTRLINARRGDKAKLTTETVQAIRKLSAEGKSQREIGTLFDLSHSTVGYVVRGERWGDV